MRRPTPAEQAPAYLAVVAASRTCILVVSPRQVPAPADGVRGVRPGVLRGDSGTRARVRAAKHPPAGHNPKLVRRRANSSRRNVLPFPQYPVPVLQRQMPTQQLIPSATASSCASQLQPSNLCSNPWPCAPLQTPCARQQQTCTQLFKTPYPADPLGRSSSCCTSPREPPRTRLPAPC